MKKLSFAVLPVAVASVLSGMAPAMAADTIVDTIKEGKASLSVRARYERVDDETKTETANAGTLRTVLGFKTGAYHGVSAFVEFEDVTDPFNDLYYDNLGALGNGNTTYPVVADPEVTQVNQAYLAYEGFKYGRQKVILNNARFVGDVGWRQNDQTFDAITWDSAKLIPYVNVQAGNIFAVNSIYGVERSVSAPFLNVKVTPVANNNVTLFGYAVEENNTVAAPTSVSAVNSFGHYGVRVDGVIGGFLYDVSAAEQDRYEDATAAGTLDADYLDIQLGYKFSDALTVKVQQELLDKGFKTPLATLHAFNGWADKFLATPGNGLVDQNVKVMAKVAGSPVTVAYHQFSPKIGSGDYGSEIDLSVGKKISDNLSALIKYAKYDGDSSSPVVAQSKDLEKIWLQFEFKM